MYDDIAPYYDRIYAPFKDYPGEARQIRELVALHHPQARTLLDVGCGTGAHAGQLSGHFDVSGLDLSAGLLRVARERYPALPFHHGSMEDFRLATRYDVITCLFGSAGYMRDTTRLARAIANMADHLAPGGLLVLEPWLQPDRFRADGITHNVLDDPDLKVSWMYVARREDRLSIFDIHYLVATASGVSHYRDEQVLGLFTHEEYLAAIDAAGLALVAHDERGMHGYGLYVCRRG